MPSYFLPAKAGQGPCNSSARVTIPIFTRLDLRKRTRYPANRTVELVLMNSLRLGHTVTLDARFACTILRGGRPRLFIALDNARRPALAIHNTSNVLVYDVSFYLPVRAIAPPCLGVPEIRGNFTCPTISIWRSFGVQMAKVGAKEAGGMEGSASTCGAVPLYWQLVRRTRTTSPRSMEASFPRRRQCA